MIPPRNRDEKTILGLTVLAALAACAAMVVFNEDCTPAQSAAAVDAGSCIVGDALAGESVAQIATNCLTDVATVITTLAASTTPAVQATSAWGEANRARRALGYDAGAK